MNLGALVTSLGVDSSGLWEAEKDMTAFAQKVEKDMTKLQSTLDKVGTQFQNFGKKATAYVTAPILAAGGYAFKMASDMNESLNKVDVAFKSSAKNVTLWSNATLDSFGIAQGTALDMSSLFGDMATSMGLTTTTAADMSKSLVGLAGDMSSFKNIGIDQTQTALAGIFTGETESLKRLGIVMTEINLQEYALSQGIRKKLDVMTQAEKVQLRYNYVLSVTKNAQGDFVRTQGGAANQMRIFMESIKETSATFGQLLVPSITDALKWTNGLMKQIAGLDETTKKWVIGIGIGAAAIGPLAFVIGSVMKAFALLTTVITGTSTAVTFLTAAIASNPWGFIITALAATAAGMYYYLNSVDKATESQTKLNYELDKTQKLQNSMTGVSDKAASISGMDKPQLEAYQAELKSAMAQVKDIQNTSYQDFLNQDKSYLDTKEKMLKETDNIQKFRYEKQLLGIQGTLENELFYERLTASEKLKTLINYYNQAEAAKSKFNKTVINTKVAEANAQAALSFQGLDTNIKLFGKSIDDNQNRLAIYTTQLSALKQAGITGGEGIKNIAERIKGLQSTIDMTKLPAISAATSISKNYVPTKATGGTFNQGLSTSSKEIVQTTTQLGNMASVYQRVEVAQKKLMEPGKWEVFGSTIDSVAQNLNSLGNAIVSAMDDGSVSFVEASNIIMQAAISTIGILTALAAAHMIAAESSKGLIGIVTAIAGLALLAGLFATFVTPKTKSAKMANGGTVPAGYPNDSYPAMLTSGETVVPPDKLGKNFGDNSYKKWVFKIHRKELVAILEGAAVTGRSF